MPELSDVSQLLVSAGAVKYMIEANGLWRRGQNGTTTNSNGAALRPQARLSFTGSPRIGSSRYPLPPIRAAPEISAVSKRLVLVGGGIQERGERITGKLARLITAKTGPHTPPPATTTRNLTDPEGAALR